MKKTIIALFAALFALGMIPVVIASIPKSNEPAVTPGQDLLKDFVPEKAYEAALQKFSKADNYKWFYTHDIQMGAAHIAHHDITEIRDGDNWYLQTPVGRVTTKLTYADGVMYRIEDDALDGETKTKATMTEEEFWKFFPCERLDEMGKGSVLRFETATATQEDNVVVVTFQLNEEEMALMAGDLSILVDLGTPEDSIRFIKGTYSLRFNEAGDLIGIRCGIDITFLVGTSTAEGTVSIQSTISYGDAKVEAPEKADTYTDVTDETESNLK